jgi:hypothetical protein
MIILCLLFVQHIYMHECGILSKVCISMKTKSLRPPEQRPLEKEEGQTHYTPGISSSFRFLILFNKDSVSYSISINTKSLTFTIKFFEPVDVLHLKTQGQSQILILFFYI